MCLAPRIARKRGADGFLRLGLDDVHDAVLVGERPAQDYEARVHETVHERRVRRPPGLFLERRDGSHRGPERVSTTWNVATLSFYQPRALALPTARRRDSGAAGSTLPHRAARR